MQKKKMLAATIALGALPCAVLPIVTLSSCGQNKELNNCVGVTVEDECEMSINVYHDKYSTLQPYLPNIMVSADNGKTWTDISPKEENDEIISTYTIPAGKTVYLKGDNPEKFSQSSKDFTFFHFNAKTSIKGNVMGLLDNGTNTIKDIPCDCCFNYLFNGNDRITSVDKNFLPATHLKPHCYSFMFVNNLYLTQVPDLPATDLSDADHCYSGMFTACVRMEQAPKLPAMHLSRGCYQLMFENCGSLETPPELPAKVMAPECYEHMFNGCGLTTLPRLDSLELADSCYHGMFSYLQSLKTFNIVLPATKLASGAYQEMFENCWYATSFSDPEHFFPKSIVTAPYCFQGMFAYNYRLHSNIIKMPSVNEYDAFCCAYMFQECHSIQYMPKFAGASVREGSFEGTFIRCAGLTSTYEDGKRITLPSFSLAKGCYKSMFEGCNNKNFTQSPILPCENLVDECYAKMFKGCTYLTTVTANFTNWELEDNCTSEWLANVAAEGQFHYVNGLDTSVTPGPDTIPAGWSFVPQPD